MHINEIIDQLKKYISYLESKTIQGQTWKPNIFYKPIDDKYQYRYIVVYRDDWKSYSEKKRGM